MKKRGQIIAIFQPDTLITVSLAGQDPEAEKDLGNTVVQLEVWQKRPSPLKQAQDSGYAYGRAGLEATSHQLPDRQRTHSVENAGVREMLENAYQQMRNIKPAEIKRWLAGWMREVLHALLENLTQLPRTSHEPIGYAPVVIVILLCLRYATACAQAEPVQLPPEGTAITTGEVSLPPAEVTQETPTPEPTPRPTETAIPATQEANFDEGQVKEVLPGYIPDQPPGTGGTDSGITFRPESAGGTVNTSDLKEQQLVPLTFAGENLSVVFGQSAFIPYLDNITSRSTGETLYYSEPDSGAGFVAYKNQDGSYLEYWLTHVPLPPDAHTVVAAVSYRNNDRGTVYALALDNQGKIMARLPIVFSQSEKPTVITQPDGSISVLVNGQILEFNLETLNWQEVTQAVVSVDNPYAVVFSKDIAGMSNEDLYQSAPIFAPEFDYTRYGFAAGEVTSLTKGEIVDAQGNKTGEVIQVNGVRFIPYYDQNQNLRMWWNTEQNTMEHAEKSVYIDSATGFTLQTIIATDDEWRVRSTNAAGQTNPWWWGLTEVEPGIVARSIFQSLALNNFFFNHHDQFVSEFRPIRGYDFVWYQPQGTDYLLGRIYTRAIELLRQDLNTLPADGRLKVKIGPTDHGELTKAGFQVYVRKVYSSNYGLGFYYGDENPFYPFGIFTVSATAAGQAQINVNMDRGFASFLGNYLVGDPLVHVITGLTVGEPFALIESDGSAGTIIRGLTDPMFLQLCEGRLEAYRKLIDKNYPGVFTINTPNGVITTVPRTDSFNPHPNMCVVETRR